MRTAGQKYSAIAGKVTFAFLRTFLWVTGGTLFVMVLLLALLNWSPVGGWMAKRVSAALSEKFQTTVTVDGIRIGFPHTVELHGLYLEDRNSDTLIYLEHVYADLRLAALLNQEIRIGTAGIGGGMVRLKRIYPDTLFNLDHLFTNDTEHDQTGGDGDSTGTWRFAIEEAGINNVVVHYIDETGGLDLRCTCKSVTCSFDDFDTGSYKLAVRKLKMDHARVFLQQDQSRLPASPPSATVAPWTFSAQEMQLNNILIDYRDNAGGSYYRSEVRQLRLADGEVNLAGSKISVADVFVSADTQIQLAQDSGLATASGSPAPISESAVPWRINVSQLQVDSSAFGLEQGKRTMAKGFDAAGISIRGLRLKTGHIRVAGDSVSAVVNRLAFSEEHGFELKHLSGAFEYHTEGASARTLSLASSHSRLSGSVTVTYPSIDTLTNAPETVTAALSINRSSVAMHDLTYFVPGLSRSVTAGPGEKIELEGVVAGGLRKLACQLRVGWKSSEVKIKATGEHLSRPDELFVTIDTLHLQSGAADIAPFVPRTATTSSDRWPDNVQIDLRAKGYLRNFDADLSVTGSAGSLLAIVRMDPASGNNPAPYSGTFEGVGLQLGALTGNKDLGPVTFSAGIAGTGFDTASFDTEVRLHVTGFQFRGYNYSDLTVDGRLVKSAFRGHSAMFDPNLAFDFNGLVNIDKTSSEYNFELDLVGADLKNLHLAREDLRVAGKLRAGIRLPSGSNPQGTVHINDVTVIREGNTHRLDSLVFRSYRLDGIDHLDVSSEKLKGSARGQFVLAQLGASLEHYLYSHFRPAPGIDTLAAVDQAIEIRFQLREPEFLTAGLVPGLRHLHPFEFTAGFNSMERILTADLVLPGAQFGNIRTDSVLFSLKGDRHAIDAKLTASRMSDSANFRFANIRIASEVRNDSAEFSLSAAKHDGTKMLETAGVLLGGDSALLLKLFPGIILAGEQWTIDSSNVIRFGSRPLHVSDWWLKSDGQSFRLAHATGPESPLTAEFQDFRIGTLTRVLNDSVPLATGTANGRFALIREGGQTAFRSDLKITGLHYRNVELGDVSLKAGNLSGRNEFNIAAEVSGNGNDLLLDGSYKPGQGAMSFLLTVRRLRMETLEPFAAGEVTGMAGWAAGEIRVTGTADKPQLNGFVNLHETEFRPRLINTLLRIPGGELRLAGGQIKLEGLPVLDSLGNRATLDGVVKIGTPAAPEFDLRLRTKNFLALNTTRADNPLYFGRVFLDSDVKITGTTERPVVDLKARLNKGSALTYVTPEEEIARDASEGIVVFSDTLGEYTRILSRSRDSVSVKGVEGVSVNADLTVDRNFELKVIVDPVAGDSLFVRGGGRLHFGMDPGGGTSLSGKYDITGGNYFLTISELVKRDFTIVKGSSVTWSGDPLDPFLDLKAVYRVKASPYELLQDQAAGDDDPDAVKYRNLLAFDVQLGMTGFLASPQIAFDIALAAADRGAHGGAVDTRLAQLREDESQMNRQVFALLTLRRFVGDNPLEGGGGGLASAGRSSASKILTQQLNTLSDRYVNFVDLDLGVNSYEDYSTGEQQGRTQVQVGVSRQLFDDRVTVRVGGNVDVEGPQASQNDLNDVAGDLGIDYKLTRDGRYRIKAFRENQYENPIEGEITSTGVGFVFSRDFNRFRNLFRKPRWQTNDATAKK